VTSPQPDPYLTTLDLIQTSLDREKLRRICQMPEHEFPRAFGLDRQTVARKGPENWYAFRDNGASVLAVAHLDTVVRHQQRLCNFVETAGGEIVYSGALDDRLGAYVILDMLPKLGINVDVLLTVGEESGQSTTG
jgi:acetylornithine deacetylase/succinyl-diaminopimelate desuccinylase-like protein